MLTRHVATTDTLASNPKGVRDNLRYLKLRLHGVKIAAGDDASVAALGELFDRAVKAAAGNAAPTASHVAEGWRAVCVALLVAPEFHTY